MRYKMVRHTFVLALIFSMLMLPMLTGCTKHPSTEELGQLDEARLSAEAAEKMVQEKKAEKAQLQQELARKQAELKALQEKRDAVKSKVD
ncbi:MAG: hypothetical protein V1800_02970 [Candidatus Latescibacterota bacterium]